MSSEIVYRSPHQDRIHAATQVADVAGGINFPTSKGQASQLTDTFVIAHYDGEGASTLALFLSQFIEPEPMVIEVATPASRAFKSVPPERRFTPPIGVENPVRTAMDERLRHPEIPTIVEFGRVHWRDAIDIAVRLEKPPLSATAYFCFLASENDRTLQIPNLAKEAGVQNIIVFGGYKLPRETRPGVIKIPTLPSDMQRLIYSEGLSLSDAVNASIDRFSILDFVLEFQGFGGNVLWDMMG